MALTAGTRLGAYEILEPLGAGGMGEVYRARDTRLNRDVALKTLPDLFAADPERLARFRREAQVLASLNHPNIAHIHGFEELTAESKDPSARSGGASGPPPRGSAVLVMELVPGEDLAARIARGPVPLAEALPIAAQMAEALEAAHEAGVIHRDLKPANVKVTDAGVVKVLDFGLAKAFDTDPSRSGAHDPSAAQSPTLTARATQMGVILGTAAYMAPEQAKGRPVDRRADLWAFGVVLYEMLTGRRAFEGGDVTEVLASVIKDAPALDALPPDTPLPVRRLLRRCLQKDRKDRIADASTARLEIAEALAPAEPGAAAASIPAAGTARGRGLNPVVLGGGVLLAVLAALAAWWLKPPPAVPPAGVARFTQSLQPGQNWTRLSQHVIAMSADGTRLAFIVNNQLLVRAIDQFEATAVASVRDPAEVFLSPDGEWAGFYADGKLWRVATTGGTPMVICPAGPLTGATWGADDTVVFSVTDKILRVPATGGTPDTLVSRTKTERFGSPQMLPGGRALLYSRALASGTWDDAEVVVERLDTHAQTVIVRGGSDARYLPGGYVIYTRASDLFAVPFDLETLETRGSPVMIVGGVAGAIAGLSGEYQFAFSDTGTLVYVSGASVSDLQLTWIGLDGKETPVAVAPGANYPRVSPDGTRIAFMATVSGNADVYVRERARNAQSRLTFDASRDLSPVWTVDSKRIIYASGREGGQNLYWQAADGTGTAERLTTNPNDQFPYAVTPDGRSVIYIELGDKTSYDIYAVDLTGDRKPRALLATPFDERRPSLSPDGKWMVYQSNESGQFELFVRPYPDVDGGRWQVSAGGGSSPLWSPGGREIFYRQGQTIQRVAVQTSPVFSAGTPSPLFQTALPIDSAGMSYGVAPDGRQFIVAKPETGTAGLVEYRVVLNWIEDVRARVRVGK